MDGFVDVNGARTHYVREGSGAPLVWLHGTGGADDWTPFHAALAQRFDVIAPDHLGFGQSDRPEWLEGIDDMVLHYLDFFDALGLDSVHLAGSSLGGWIAAEIAVLFSRRLRSLTLVDSAGLHVPGSPIGDLFMMTPEERVRCLYHDTRMADERLAEPASDAAISREVKAMATLALLAWNPYLHNPKLPRRLRRISAPALVVWGEYDALIPLAHGHRYASLIPGASLFVIPECGHVPAREKTQALVSRLTSFAEGCS